jgi:Tol biopolymer transport system component/DNA-binding winged helix-turn-helix (wHTH) protein
MTVFEFGPFVLDPAKRSLLRDGVPQPLTPKAFDVLMLLVRHRERVVPKDELLSSIWPDTFVEEANLTQHIFVLRRTLEGNGTQGGHGISSKGADAPEYITTVPRRGYRFTADVVERAENERPAMAPHTRRSIGRRVWLVSSLAGVALLIAIAAVRWRDRAAGTEPRVRPVTSLPGLEGSPSLSPDGNSVVFSWTGPDPEGAPDLWIKAVDGEKMRPLTRTPAPEFNPAWSPDGRSIAFVRGGQGVFIISAEGGHERPVINAGSIVGWTPDSQWLLVRVRTQEGPHGIVRIDPQSGKRGPVTRPPGGVGDGAFDVSPDGKTLAFVRSERPGISDLYTVPITGGEPRRRTDWSLSIGNVAWSWDGRDLLYSISPPDVGPSVFRVAAHGEGVGRGVRVLQTSGPGLSMSRPAAGRAPRLAFTSERVDINIRRVNLEGARGEIFKVVDRFYDSTRWDVPGPFSHDGNQVALGSDRTGWPEVWVANTDGSGLKSLTTIHAAEMLIGAWSPLDDQLVIDAAIDGNSEVYVIPLDGGPPRQVTHEASYDGLADWSSDGRWIYFTSTRSGQPDIWKVPADGVGEAIRLTQNGGLQPREAPDGRTVFYLDRPPPGPGGTSGTARLMSVPSVPVSGGQEHVVVDGVRMGLWSVLRDGIVFLSIEPKADVIDFYRFGDRTVQRLGTLPFRVSRVAGLGGLTVSRDGRLALVSVTDARESDIMVADGVR